MALADFGVALRVPKDRQEITRIMTRLIGTPGYMDPLILKFRSWRSMLGPEDYIQMTAEEVLKADIFGLGCSLHFLITGK